MDRNLLARIAVAAAAIPIILWIAYQGGDWLLGMVGIFAVLAMWEYLKAEQISFSHPIAWFAIALVVISVLAERFGGPDRVRPAPHADQIRLTVLIGFFLATSLSYAVGRRQPSQLFATTTRLFWGVAYIALLYPFVYKVGAASGALPGGDLLLMLFAILWLGDTAAMGIGAWLGTHQLAPTVSPNKTIEGLIGGLVGALIAGLAIWWWRFAEAEWMTFVDAIILALGCSLVGQLGDLVESMWKRSRGIKDSSSIIPGHGGVLDRFDSLLFAAPFMYGYVRLIIL